jgi:hydrogenase maturation protein HypF
MVDRGLGGTVIGLAFDGTGYGPDGSIWGAEVLIADLKDYRRAAHLQTIALPGGEASIKKPARMALAYLLAAFGDEGPGVGRRLVPSLSAMEAEVVARQFATGLNSPVASSMGRLFDAVSVLLGGSPVATYEGQAAADLEAMAAKARSSTLTPRCGEWSSVLRKAMIRGRLRRGSTRLLRNARRRCAAS